MVDAGEAFLAGLGGASPLRERLFQPLPHQGNARTRHLLTERCRREGVCFQNDSLPFGLEAAPDDEERSMCTRPPFLNRCQRASRHHPAGGGEARDTSDCFGDLHRLDGEGFRAGSKLTFIVAQALQTLPCPCHGRCCVDSGD